MQDQKEDAPGCNRERRNRITGLIQRTGSAKSRALDVSEYIRASVAGQCRQALAPFGLPFDVEGLRQRASELAGCSTLLRLKDYFEIDDYRIETFRCRQHLICGPCAIVRGTNNVRSIMERFEVVRRTTAGRIYPYLLTMGVKTGPDLSERCRHMAGCWRKLLEDRRCRSGRHGNELSGLLGGVYSFEAKIGKGAEREGKRLWNFHMHALIFSPEPLPVQPGIGGDGKARYYWPELSERWRGLTGDSFIVECHPIVDRSRAAAVAEGDAMDAVVGDVADGSLIAAVCEVSKYAVKVADSAPGDAVEAWASLRGRHLCGSFGAFRGVDLAEENPRLSLRELAAYVEYVYRFNVGSKGYSIEGFRLHRGVPDGATKAAMV